MKVFNQLRQGLMRFVGFGVARIWLARQLDFA